MGYLTIWTNVRHYQTHQRWHFFLSGKQFIGAHALACNTVQLLWQSRLPFSWTMPPTARSWTHRLQDLESCAAPWVWVASQKDWRNQGTTGWILTMHWYSSWVKNAIFVFLRLPGSAEAHVIWGGTVKHLLIAYFISNISAKKVSKCVHVCQSYSKPKVGRFLRQCNVVDKTKSWTWGWNAMQVHRHLLVDDIFLSSLNICLSVDKRMTSAAHETSCSCISYV